MDQHKGTHWSVERVVGILRDLATQEELPSHLLSGSIVGSDTVATLGIDSIGAVELIDRLEAESDVLLPDDFLSFEDSIDDIVQRMNTLQ